ncbi:hypothetical protein brsh051_26120 [Brooklawnia propionicigenes]|uniref:Uncharacterized protein n=1 Tax=Brooklawnia propionicigenes TaxID=3041175 RepID=A0AAN0K7V3_9ACTN|nr:hypothetical protein brsh051_26120 [Brooklawnia sp. SH051]
MHDRNQRAEDAVGGLEVHLPEFASIDPLDRDSCTHRFIMPRLSPDKHIAAPRGDGTAMRGHDADGVSLRPWRAVSSA